MCSLDFSGFKWIDSVLLPNFKNHHISLLVVFTRKGRNKKTIDTDIFGIFYTLNVDIADLTGFSKTFFVVSIFNPTFTNERIEVYRN